MILDAIPAPVFYKDAAGVYRGCNKAFAVYLGKPRAEIVGKDVYGLSPSTPTARTTTSSSTRRRSTTTAASSPA